MKPHFGQSDAAMNKLAGCNKFENGTGSISNQKVLDGLKTIASLELQAKNAGFETQLEYLKAEHEEAAGMGLEPMFFERNPHLIRKMQPAVNMTDSMTPIVEDFDPIKERDAAYDLGYKDAQREHMTPDPLPEGYYGHHNGCDCAVCEDIHMSELAKQQVDAAWNKLLDDYKSATVRINELEAVLEAERKNVAYAQQKWSETEERVEKWKIWYESVSESAAQYKEALNQISKQPLEPAHIYEIAERMKRIAKSALED